jgi:hypothetical protein
MARVTEIAVREFRTTVLTKAFLLAAIVLPAVFWILGLALPFLLRPEPKRLEGVIAAVDSASPAGASVLVRSRANRRVGSRGATVPCVVPARTCRSDHAHVSTATPNIG